MMSPAATMGPALCKLSALTVSFNRSRKIPAVLNGGMRINYSGADPPRDGRCTQLLTGIIVLDWDKKTASVLPQFRMDCSVRYL